MMMKRYYTFFAVLAIISALAITSNTLLRRGPVHDATAAQDIRNLQSAVDTYFLTQNKLPGNLREVELDGLDVAKRLSDYEYVRVDASTYELCATFQTEHRTTKDYYSPGAAKLADPDNHGKGRECFSYKALRVEADLPGR